MIDHPTYSKVALSILLGLLCGCQPEGEGVAGTQASTAPSTTTSMPGNREHRIDLAICKDEECEDTCEGDYWNIVVPPDPTVRCGTKTNGYCDEKNANIHWQIEDPDNTPSVKYQLRISYDPSKPPASGTTQYQQAYCGGTTCQSPYAAGVLNAHSNGHHKPKPSGDPMTSWTYRIELFRDNGNGGDKVACADPQIIIDDGTVIRNDDDDQGDDADDSGSSDDEERPGDG